jgi:hypothetical protein
LNNLWHSDRRPAEIAGQHVCGTCGVGFVHLDFRALDRQFPAFRHGVARVHAQVQSHLLELRAIGFHDSQRIGQREKKLDVLARGTGYKSSLDMPDLRRDQENFLRVLQEHLDDCYLMLKALVDPASATKTLLFADKYVIENRMAGARSFHSFNPRRLELGSRSMHLLDSLVRCVVRRGSRLECLPELIQTIPKI